MKTQDWVETSILLDNGICPTISASGVSLSIIIVVLFGGSGALCVSCDITVCVHACEVNCAKPCTIA